MLLPLAAVTRSLGRQFGAAAVSSTRMVHTTSPAVGLLIATEVYNSRRSKQVQGSSAFFALRHNQTCHIRTSAVAMKDLYDVLGVDKKASKSDIKKAYYKLAKEYHPDANPGDETAAKRFADISEAYETLSNESSRQAYDSGGGQAGGGPFGFGGGFGGQSQEELFNNLNSMFGGQGFGSRGPNAPRRGADVQAELQITFDDAVTGTTRTLRYETRVSCDDCSGTGSADSSQPSNCPVCHGSGVETMTMQGFLQYQSTCRKCDGEGTIITNPCHSCNGRGLVRSDKQVSVDIPPGIDDMMDIRLLSQGHAGEKGGPAGNLYVRVRVLKSKDFQRDGSDIQSTVTLSLAQAVLGGTVYVKGIRGDVKLKVKPGTQSGHVARLPDRGMPKVNNPRQHGHHYVEMNVKIPELLSARQKELMLEWAREEGDLAHGGSIAGLEEVTSTKPEKEPEDELKRDDGWFSSGSWFSSKKEKKGNDGEDIAEAK